MDAIKKVSKTPGICPSFPLPFTPVHRLKSNKLSKPNLLKPPFSSPH